MTSSSSYRIEEVNEIGFPFVVYRIEEQASHCKKLTAECGMLTNSMRQLEAQNTCLRDEHTALQLAFTSLEDKLRKVQVSSPF